MLLKEIKPWKLPVLCLLMVIINQHYLDGSQSGCDVGTWSMVYVCSRCPPSCMNTHTCEDPLTKKRILYTQIIQAVQWFRERALTEMRRNWKRRFSCYSTFMFGYLGLHLYCILFICTSTYVMCINLNIVEYAQILCVLCICACVTCILCTWVKLYMYIYIYIYVYKCV